MLLALGRERFATNLATFMRERQWLVWLLAMGIGVMVAYAALSFRIAIGAVHWLWLGTAGERVYEAAASVDWYVILLAPALGGLVVGLILQYLMPGKRAFGVADVIEARAIGGCRIPIRGGLLSAGISAISLGAGASAGREGPVVHLGAALAPAIEDRFKLGHQERRTLLGCGVAAAVSASFNVPIAGFLFAHEVILQHYGFRAFVPVAISSVIGAIITRLHLGDYPAFSIPTYSITSYWEFPAFALLGLTCAIVAILFQFALVYADHMAREITLPLWLRPVVGGLMVGAIALWFPQVLGVGYDATDAALQQSLPLSLLLALIVAKTAATAITFASRFGGGVFSPALYVGAMTGGAYGLIAASVFPEIASSHGLYAILGMGAVAAAVLGAPISTTVIVFELTGGYDMTIALIVSVSIAVGLNQAVHGLSFFHWQLSMRGLMLHEGPHKHILRTLTVKDFCKAVPAPYDREPGATVLSLDDTIEQALRAFDRTGAPRLAVVNADRPETMIAEVEHVMALTALNTALIDAHVEEHR